MAPVKVYGPPLSPNVARVLVCLEEAGAAYDIVPVDFFKGEHKGPDHLARNPFGQVPALQDGDLFLFESRAISRYVLRKYGSGGEDLLREGSAEEAAKVDVWLEVEAHQFTPAISPIIVQCLVVPMRGGTPDEKIVDESVKKLEAVMAVYEDHLSKNKYLAGDFVSFADISHFAYGYYLGKTPYGGVLDKLPHVRAWLDGLIARPAVQKVLALQKPPGH